MKSISQLLVIFAGVLATAAFASANMFSFTFSLSGLQENPPVVTPGFGSATVTLDTTTNEVTWDVTYQDMLGTLTMAHIHGPAAIGVNAGVLVNLNPTIGSNSGSIVGSATVTPTIAQHIQDGLTYINLHSSVHGGGELRGQIIPEPSTYALFAGIAALAGVAFWRRRATR